MILRYLKQIKKRKHLICILTWYYAAGGKGDQDCPL